MISELLLYVFLKITGLIIVLLTAVLYRAERSLTDLEKYRVTASNILRQRE